MTTLRRLLFERLFLNLALLLGLSQVLVWHWLLVVTDADGGGGFWPTLALAVVLVTANGLVVPVLRRTRRRADWVGHAARVYMNLGVSTLLLGVTIAAVWIACLLLLGILGAFGASGDLGHHVFRAVSTGTVGSVALLLFWGFTFGQIRVALTHVHAPVPGLHPSHEGLRIVQISDLHIGNHLDGDPLSRMVERVNALDPDLIVVTGDIFDFDPSFVPDGALRLSALRARHGVYAVLGNHDTYVGAELVAESLARYAPGLRLLRDEIVRLPLPQPLYLAGVEDPGCDWSARGVELDGLSDVAAVRPEDGPTLLLVHRPEAFPQAASLGFPLVLAGHTHGGQLALPLTGGRHNLARIVTSFTRGAYRRDGTLMYVNRGFGVGGPALRINCSREIATIELRAGAAR